MKNIKLNQWLWRWHFIAGVIAIPFVLVLSITGAIYLFKDNVEKPHVKQIQTIIPDEVEITISFEEQLRIANEESAKPITEMVIPQKEDQSTAFAYGRFSHKKTTYVNPYNGKVTGAFKAQDTWMYTVRKLHGELLGGSVGTKIVELIACWVVVLLLTGLYIWFPLKKWKSGGMFTIRMNRGRQIFFRDVHAVTGFWISIILLITLAGGFPWTDIVGGNFKTLQKLTNTGYPPSWHGIGLSSKDAAEYSESLSIDDMVEIAKAEKLKGVVSIGLPKSKTSTFKVFNKTFDLGAQKMLHFDQYSGRLVKSHDWSDVGILMRGRMWAMAFHQGQLGGWNWWLMFIFSILLAMMSLAAMFSYLGRKPQDDWGVPPTPAGFQVGKGVLLLIGILAIVFPLFGGSLLLILGWKYFFK